MLSPCTRIHERLDDCDHPKECQCRHACRQTKCKQRRTTPLEGRRQKSRKLWGQYRDLVLTGEKKPYGRLRFGQQDGQCRDRRIPSQALERSEARTSSHVAFGVVPPANQWQGASLELRKCGARNPIPAPHLGMAQLSLMVRPSLAALQATVVISWPRADRRQSYHTSLPGRRATHPPAHRAWRCQHMTNSPSDSRSCPPWQPHNTSQLQTGAWEQGRFAH
jgi:hypothetical protein